ncbi:L-rhamnose mutarotase [Arthrobacter glacialis]|uniref:L-rhamnose mutarotase n=1 Tax=Arthrobacter glacialis TaxID=1664 RepID=UPI000CD3E775|nr:L-rhamnose mutarotase [Arthrobacter glacialis]POH61253.1 L-rhamnose mutarotase [Arthrobacter glacialis]
MTQKIALHTRLLPGKEADYDSVHATIGGDLDAALRTAGVTSWNIWRSGRELFHVVEVADYQAMRKELALNPVNIAWQAVMSELLEVEDDYSGDDMGLAKVWELP